VSPIVTLRNNISVVEGQGGNIAVLTGPDGKVLIDAGVASHFDHASGNEWLHAAGKDYRPKKHPEASKAIRCVSSRHGFEARAGNPWAIPCQPQRIAQA
jgi:hypothetical protein